MKLSLDAELVAKQLAWFWPFQNTLQKLTNEWPENGDEYSPPLPIKSDLLVIESFMNQIGLLLMQTFTSNKNR